MRGDLVCAQIGIVVFLAVENFQGVFLSIISALCKRNISRLSLLLYVQVETTCWHIDVRIAILHFLWQDVFGDNLVSVEKCVNEVRNVIA